VREIFVGFFVCVGVCEGAVRGVFFRIGAVKLMECYALSGRDSNDERVDAVW
jgi:hypothetical protein